MGIAIPHFGLSYAEQPRNRPETANRMDTRNETTTQPPRSGPMRRHLGPGIRTHDTRDTDQSRRPAKTYRSYETPAMPFACIRARSEASFRLAGAKASATFIAE
jgi:hypothetical protein